MIPGPRGARVVRLDGGVGTALIARGLPQDQLPEAWVLRRPWEVAAVHASHARAGAEVLLTCTFNLARLDLAGPDLDTGEVARRAVALARLARPAAVAGCVGATGLSGRDGRGPSAGEYRERYGLACGALAAAGADLIWVETQVHREEARAALAGGRGTGLPVVVTIHLVPSPAGMVALDGSPGSDLLEVLWRDGASAVGVNCVAPDWALVHLVAQAAARIPVPLVVKPNAGLPGAPVGPVEFATGVAAAVRAGASLAGGCCGAGAEHLRALAAATGRMRQARGYDPRSSIM